VNHIDLFSGIGGFAISAQLAAIDTIQFVEKDSFCQKVLNKNFPNVDIHDDVKTYTFNGKIDLITAGFPCQPFSIAGSKRGKYDDRYLWPEVIRVIRECKPTWFIGENVPGIISHLDPILSDLENEGYDWRTFLIPASAVGAPHKRERVWIIAHANSVRCDNGANIGKKRFSEEEQKRYIEALQTEWKQFQPVTWATFNFKEWLEPITNADSISSNETYSRTFSQQIERRTWLGYSRQDWIPSPAVERVKDESGVLRVDDGLSNNVDRNKSLGNAIVPQIAYLLMMMIKKVEEIKEYKL
jgi:DNA (cytosine-5)-methyltransferase 1